MVVVVGVVEEEEEEEEEEAEEAEEEAEGEEDEGADIGRMLRRRAGVRGAVRANRINDCSECIRTFLFNDYV